MLINPNEIKTEQEYKIVLQKIEELMGAVRGTNEGVELDRLVFLVEKYENKQKYLTG